ncbi:universal stress protein [Nocardioides sp. CN2-186]|uniref:universal stress protein n=1 Tax=Nocardioides tweenelious TaxID=3156607 RepID=UPI0032B3876D
METTVIPSGTVVVGVDGSPSAALALDWAIEQARLEQRPLTLAHADLDGGHDVRAVLDEAWARIHERAPHVAVYEVTAMTDPRTVLLDLAERAALLVVGSRGRGPVTSLVLGSVSVAVTRHASCPTVVVRPGHRGIVRHGVLAGVDGTEHSLVPLEFAYLQASLRRLPLTVLHCSRDLLPDSDDELRLVVSETMSGLGEKYPDVRARVELARGPADSSLARAAQRMDLVVLGVDHAGEHATLGTLLGGSVSVSVLEHATCPVALVPVHAGGGW